MRRFCVVLVAAICLVLAPHVHAAYFAFFQLTVDNTAGGVGFSAAQLQRTNINFLQCRLRTAEISYLYTDPAVTAVTTTVGTLLEVGDVITFTQRDDMLNFRAIRTTGTSGQLDCHVKAPS